MKPFIKFFNWLKINKNNEKKIFFRYKNNEKKIFFRYKNNEKKLFFRYKNNEKKIFFRYKNNEKNITRKSGFKCRTKHGKTIISFSIYKRALKPGFEKFSRH